MSTQRYEDHVGSIVQITKRAYGRASAANMPVCFEELKQEVTLAWVVASNGFDPEKGCEFSTYFYNVAFSRLNKFFDKLGKQTIELGLTSSTIATEDGDTQIEDITESDLSEPDASLLMSENFQQFYENLKSPDARLAIDMLIDTPDYVEAELNAQQAKTDTKRAQGRDSRCARDLNLKFILRLIARLRCEKDTYAHKLHAEIRQSAIACLVS